MPLCLDDGCSLAPYVPYLQIAFATNLIFGLWHNIYRERIKELTRINAKQRRLARANAISQELSFEDLRTTLKNGEQCIQLFWNIGRYSSGILALGIAMLLLLVRPTTEVDSALWTVFLCVAGGLTPFMMLLMAGCGIAHRNSAQARLKRLLKHAAEQEVKYSGEVDDTMNKLQDEPPDDPSDEPPDKSGPA